MGAGGPQPAYQVTPGDFQLEVVPLDIEDPEALVYVMDALFPLNNEVVDDYEEEKNSDDDERVVEPEEPLSLEGAMDQCLDFNCNNNAKNEPILVDRSKSRHGGPVDSARYHHQITRSFQSPYPTCIMNSSSNNTNMTYSTDEEGDLGQGNEHGLEAEELSNRSIMQDARRPDIRLTIEDLRLLKISSVTKCNRNQSMGGTLSGEKDKSRKGGRHGRRTLEGAHKKRRKSADNTTSGNRSDAGKDRPSFCRPETSAIVPGNREETEVSTYIPASGGAVSKDVPRLSVHEDYIVDGAPQNDLLRRQARSFPGQSTTKQEIKCDGLKIIHQEQSDEDTNAENTLMEEESIYDLDPTTVTGYTSCSEWWNGNEAGGTAPPGDTHIVPVDSRNNIESLADEVDETKEFVDIHGNTFKVDAFQYVHKDVIKSKTSPDVSTAVGRSGIRMAVGENCVGTALGEHGVSTSAGGSGVSTAVGRSDVSTDTGENFKYEENLSEDIKLESTLEEVGWVSPDGESGHLLDDQADNSSITSSTKCKKRSRGRVTFKDPVAYTASSEYDFGTFFIQRSSQENWRFPPGRSGYFTTQNVTHSALVKVKSESTLDTVKGSEFLTYQEGLQDLPRPPQNLQALTPEMTKRRSRSTCPSMLHTGVLSEQNPLSCKSKKDLCLLLSSVPSASLEMISHNSTSIGEVEFVSRSVQLKSVDLKRLELSEKPIEIPDIATELPVIATEWPIIATELPDLPNELCDDFENTSKLSLLKSLSSATVVSDFALCDVDQFDVWLQVDSIESQQTYSPEIAFDLPTPSPPVTLDLRFINMAVISGAEADHITCDEREDVNRHSFAAVNSVVEHKSAGTQRLSITRDVTCCDRSLQVGSLHLEHNISEGLKSKQSGTSSCSSSNIISESVLPESLHSQLAGLNFRNQTKVASKSSTAISCHRKYQAGDLPCKPKIRISVSALGLPKNLATLQASPDECEFFVKNTQDLTLNDYMEGNGKSIGNNLPEARERTSSSIISSLHVNTSLHDLQWSQSFDVIKTSGSPRQSESQEPQTSGTGKSAGDYWDVSDDEVRTPPPNVTRKSANVSCLDLLSLLSQSFVTGKSASVICQSSDGESKPSVTVKSVSVICQSINNEFQPAVTVKSLSGTCQSFDEYQSVATVKSQSVMCQIFNEFQPTSTRKSASVVCQCLESEFETTTTAKSTSVICQSLETKLQPNETVKSVSVICQSKNNEFQPAATVKTASVICQSCDDLPTSAIFISEGVICTSLENGIQLSPIVKSASVICTSLRDQDPLGSRSYVTARSPSLICHSLDERQHFVENKSASVLCVSLDNELQSHVTADSSSFLHQNFDLKPQPLVTVKSSSATCQRLDDGLKDFDYTKAAGVLCQSQCRDSGRSRPNVTNENLSVCYKNLDGKSPTKKSTDIHSLLISNDVATLSYQQELKRSPSTSVLGTLRKANGRLFPNTTGGFGLGTTDVFNNQDASSCAPCNSDTTDIADSFTFSQTIKSSNLAEDLDCAVVQCDSCDFLSPNINKTVSVSAQCESRYFSSPDIRSQSWDSTCYIDDVVSLKQKKSVSVQISNTEWLNSDDQSIDMDSSFPCRSDDHSSLTPVTPEMKDILIKPSKHNATSNVETSCVQYGHGELTSGDHVYVKSFSIQAGEVAIEDVGTVCSLSSLRDVTTLASRSQAFEDSSIVKLMNNYRFSEYGCMHSSDQHEQSEPMFNHHKENVSLIDNCQECVSLTDLRQEYLSSIKDSEESLALIDHYEENIVLIDQIQKRLSPSNHREGNVIPMDRPIGILATDNHLQDSLSSLDNLLENGYPLDYFQKHFISNDYNPTDDGHESFTIADHLQKSLPANGHHQGSLASTKYYQECLALTDYHQERLAPTDLQTSLASIGHLHESLASIGHLHESLAPNDLQESLASNDYQHASLASTDHYQDCLTLFTQSHESVSSLDESLPQISISKKPQAAPNSVHFLPALVIQRRDQKPDRHVNKDLPKINKIDLISSPIENSVTVRTELFRQTKHSNLGGLVRLDPCRHVPELFIDSLPQNTGALSQPNSPATLQQNTPNPPQKNAPGDLEKLSSNLTKKKFPNLSFRTVNDKKVSLSDVPEEDVLSIRMTQPLNKEKELLPDIRPVKRKQSSDGRRKVPKDLELSSACDTLATKEDCVGYYTRRKSLPGKVTFSDHVNPAAMNSKRLASPHELANKDVTSSMQPSEASATLCTTLEDVDAIASSVSIATPTRNSVYALEDDASLAPCDAGEALKKSHRDNIKDDALQDVDACGDITNIFYVLHHLVKPDIRTQMPTLSELTVYTVEEDDELQIKLSEGNQETLGLVDLPTKEVTSHREQEPGDGKESEGDLAEDIEQTDMIGNLSGQALRTPGPQGVAEDDLPEQILRTPGPQADEEEYLSKSVLRTPDRKDDDRFDSAEAPDSKSSGAPAKKLEVKDTAEENYAIETSDNTYSTIVSDTETKAGGDKPQTQASKKQIPSWPPGGSPGGPPDGKKKPNEPLKRNKIDRNLLFPPRVLAESHYYKDSNTVNVVVKPVNAQLPTDGLSVKVHVHRKQSRLPAVQSQNAMMTRKRSKPSPNHTLRKGVNNMLPFITLDRDIIDLRATNPPFNTATNPEADTRYKKITRNWRVR